MKKFSKVKVDLLSNKPASNNVIYDKDSVVKAINELTHLPIQVNYDKTIPSVGVASNFNIEGDYVVADIKIKEEILPTHLGLGLQGELSIPDLEGASNVFYTKEVFSISTIPVGKHLHEGLDILE